MAISALRRVVDNAFMCHLSSAAMKTSTSMDASEQKKTKHKLKKLLSGRPTLQSIRDKGYIKGKRVFQYLEAPVSLVFHRGSSIQVFLLTLNCLKIPETSLNV